MFQSCFLICKFRTACLFLRASQQLHIHFYYFTTCQPLDNHVRVEACNVIKRKPKWWCVYLTITSLQKRKKKRKKILPQKSGLGEREENKCKIQGTQSKTKKVTLIFVVWIIRREVVVIITDYTAIMAYCCNHPRPKIAMWMYLSQLLDFFLFFIIFLSIHHEINTLQML